MKVIYFNDVKYIFWRDILTTNSSYQKVKDGISELLVSGKQNAIIGPDGKPYLNLIGAMSLVPYISMSQTVLKKFR